MTILRRPQLSVRRRNLLLIAASLVFVVPCAVAAPFAFHININPQDAAATSRRSITVEPGTLTAWLRGPGDAVERGEAIAEVQTDKGSIKIEASASGVIERLLVQLGEKVQAGATLALIRPQGQPAGAEGSPAQQAEGERKKLSEARLKAQAELDELQRRERERREWAVAHSTEPQQEARTFSFNTVDGQKVFTGAQDPQREAREKEERMLREAAKVMEELKRAELERQQSETDPELVERRRAEREAMAKRQAELAKEARLTMQQAIQIVTSQYPGAVLESRLVRERDQACYILVILSENGTETSTTRVLMSAIDGSIIKAMKQER